MRSWAGTRFGCQGRECESELGKHISDGTAILFAFVGAWDPRGCAATHEPDSVFACTLLERDEPLDALFVELELDVASFHDTVQNVRELLNDHCKVDPYIDRPAGLTEAPNLERCQLEVVEAAAYSAHHMSELVTRDHAVVCDTG